MSLAEAQPKLVILNLGCGRDIHPQAINVDLREGPGVDYTADLDYCRVSPLPFEDNYADVIILSHILEHLHDPLSLMQECHRVAKPNALCTVRCPYGSSDEAWGDQTHVRAYFLQSFEAFGQPYYSRADYGYRGDWRFDQCFVLIGPDQWQDFSETGWQREMLQRLFKERNFVTELIVELRAVKPIRPQVFVNHPPKINFVKAK